MSLNRHEQITRYLHVSDPVNTSLESTFDKLEPLNTHLRLKMRHHWYIGTHFLVDESIKRFMGRSSHTVNIPLKPEPEGYKIWVLANEGYVLD